ncbi:MAG TPA: ABC transporter ATP-binding protein [Terriglobales bacterium]|nr:ABC transporter ATP-binding protein [Terriglobales bacterium]
MRQLLRLLRYVVPYLGQLVPAVVMLAAVGFLEGFRLLLLGPIFDRVLNPASQSNNIFLINNPITHQPIYLQQLMPERLHNAWTLVAVALVSATLLKGICDYVGTYLVNYAGYGLITDLRDDLYNRILRRSVAFFHRHTTGTLLSTLINDIEKVQVAMSSVLAEFLQQLFIFAFLAFFVASKGGKLAWVLLLFVPIILVSSRRMGRRVRKTTRSGQDKLAEIQNILHETITGNRIVKAFGMERWEAHRFRTAAQRLFRANLRSVRATTISGPVMEFFGAIAIALLILLGRDQIKSGHMTAGTFVAFIFMVFRLYDPVRKFASSYNNFQQALGASSSIFSFMDVDDDVKEKPSAKIVKQFRESIRFENVSFSYADEENSRDVLQDINLDVKKGEVLAIVGSSGAGKSTLIHLNPRFFDVTGGRLLIDGTDVRELSLHSLRALIAVVTQDTILFNDTVRNNIAYGQPNVDDSKVEAAARAALADEFIREMPDGYQTIIGERGMRLSGGQRQRLAIARAILKDAPILILDEATSALDTESEALVQSAIQNLMEGRTVFVIAHRLSTVRRANRIMVLENGTIADIGTHDDLMSRLGTYRRLYDLQFEDISNGDPMRTVSDSSGI